jgi:hypothetical protein
MYQAKYVDIELALANYVPMKRILAVLFVLHFMVLGAVAEGHVHEDNRTQDDCALCRFQMQGSQSWLSIYPEPLVWRGEPVHFIVISEQIPVISPPFRKLLPRPPPLPLDTF